MVNTNVERTIFFAFTKFMENYYSNLTREIAKAGVFLSLILVTKLLFWHLPILNGYSLDIYLIIYVVSFLFLFNKQIRFIFWLAAPLCLLVIPDYFFINPIQFFLEYFVSIWVFGLCFFSYEVFLKKIKMGTLINISLFLLAWMLKLLIHVIVGKYFYLENGTFLASFIINIQIIFPNTIITVLAFFIMERVSKKMIFH
ncbi:MAG: hypothetical protein ACRC9U_00715 [Metamycoplasmataceae bacterium]